MKKLSDQLKNISGNDIVTINGVEVQEYVPGSLTDFKKEHAKQYAPAHKCLAATLGKALEDDAHKKNVLNTARELLREAGDVGVFKFKD
jgi:hypothetical protein